MVRDLEKMQMCTSCCQKRHDSGHVRKKGLDVFPRGELVTTTFYCCGRIPPEGLYRKRHLMSEQEISGSSCETAVEVYEDENIGLSKITSPVSDTTQEVPFVDDIPEELYQGRSIEVYGRLSKNAHRFSINLSTGSNNTSDIALHFNPRFDRHIIVRNHRIKNKWGVEEITSLQDFPFVRGRNFSVLIFVADEQFLIAINKIHYCAFAFRIPIERIKSLIILGDITLSYVQYFDRNVYPPVIFKKTPFLIVPRVAKTKNSKCYFRRKIKAITTGAKIDIFGRVKILPQAFYVNIQKGISVWPHPIIPFHMNYRLHRPGTHKDEKEIIFNSWLNGYWGKEEISRFVPFLPGSEFHLQIICKSNAYNVSINDKFLYSYAKRSETDVDSVVIHGDVIIKKVQLH